MLGPKQAAQGVLFYEFSIDDHVRQDHLLRSINRFVDLSISANILPRFTAILVVLRSIPNFLSVCCWWGIASVSGPNGGSAKRFI